MYIFYRVLSKRTTFLQKIIVINLRLFLSLTLLKKFVCVFANRVEKDGILLKGIIIFMIVRIGDASFVIDLNVKNFMQINYPKNILINVENFYLDN